MPSEIQYALKALLPMQLYKLHKVSKYIFGIENHHGKEGERETREEIQKMLHHNICPKIATTVMMRKKNVPCAFDALLCTCEVIAIK